MLGNDTKIHLTINDYQYSRDFRFISTSDKFLLRNFQNKDNEVIKIHYFK